MYLENGGELLSLVSTCKTAAAREEYESLPLQMAKDMTMLEIKHEK